MPAGHQAWFVRSSLLQELGGFDLSYALAADYELFLRVQRLGRLWVFTQTPLANFTLGGASYAIIPTARDYRRAKRAQGDRWLHAWAVYARNIAGSVLARNKTRLSATAGAAAGSGETVGETNHE
jgi:hypothetical protein